MHAAARRRRIRYLGLAFGGLVAAVLVVAAIVWINIDLIQRAAGDVAQAQTELTWADATLDAANDEQNALSGIIATHDLDDLSDIADRCYVLDSGRLAAEGSPGDILGDRELLQRTNLIHAHRHRHSSGEMHSHPHRHE